MTAEATVNQLQTTVEQDKGALARELHDELGGFLIASAMDVTTLRHRFAAHDDETRRQFDRLAKMLNRAIDMTRRVTEELHPTLLDNVGLFAALRWRIKHLCRRSSLTCNAELPDAEPLLGHAAAIGLYRIGEESLVIAENHPGVQTMHFTVRSEPLNWLMEVSADGASGPAVGQARVDTTVGFLRHRVTAFGGGMNVSYPDAGGVLVGLHVPKLAAAN